MESQPCIFLGIKVKPGPIERHKLENFTLDHTVDSLKTEAGKKTNLPSASLELIHHGKILRDEATLQDSGVKSGEMIHVVKKKVQASVPAPAPFSEADLQQLNASLRTLGCTPNAPGWTRAMQLLNDESAMSEILEHAPSLNEDCVTLSILHEVELLAALGANIHTMRRGAAAHPDLPHALRHLTRLVFSRSNTNTASDNVPTSGFAYSLEALSDDEEAEEEESEEGERTPITQEQLALALQAATEAVSTSSRGSSGSGSGSGSASAQDSLLRLLQATVPQRAASQPAGAGRSLITPEMFSDAISEAMGQAGARPAGTPMAQSTAASSSESPAARDEDFSTQLQHMHEMGLLDDALNVRALLICSGDVNAAINLVFSGAIGDD
ncbi:ubiquitin-like protein 7 [Pectinophora gossypiella]|uniref:ubiquitin-like protein 7 n=1 Tax=Pectinophora gossypiella TaxID=13191 RepID=UPI00214F1213|nr:ubiquitin-like protein 7 [Pectinophora gossypiella]XP_049872178.1 ubiquitin-like protein 7 [Pectinophora gossypiella]